MQAADANGALWGPCPTLRREFCVVKKVNRLVDCVLRKIAPVVTDGNAITARDTVDTPAFVRAFCKAMDLTYKDVWKVSLRGKKTLFTKILK